MQWLASIISHSKSGSSINISSSRSHTPLSRQRINLRWVLLQSPKSGGKSRHGAPVRMIQKTASIKRRLSWATPPQLPSRPGKRGSSFFQTASEMSCRLWAGRDMWSSLAVEGKRTMPQNQILDNLVTTLSRAIAVCNEFIANACAACSASASFLTCFWGASAPVLLARGAGSGSGVQSRPQLRGVSLGVVF